jgi:hypothetical protein
MWCSGCLIGFVPLFAVVSLAAAEQARLTVEGTEFKLAMPDGRVLRSADLVGASIKIGDGAQTIDLTIQSTEEDREAIGGKVVLHHFVVQGENRVTAEFCTPDTSGRSLGFPIPDGRGGFNLTCISGVVAKCVRWGYRFWEEQPGGPPLHVLHHACTHMARADYGGDGVPTTRDGTTIDLYDRFGIQKSERLPSMTFEAAWGVDGAICVARPRIPENVSLKQIADRYPHLRAKLGPETCTEEGAMQNPAALLFNRSY